jgi:hypothetical protein
MTQIQNPKYSSSVESNAIIKGRPWFARRDDRTLVGVLIIGYINLGFICNLMLEIWDFIAL